MRIRGAAVALTMLLALAGCTTTVAGTADPAPAGSSVTVPGGALSPGPGGRIVSRDGDFSVVLPDGWRTSPDTAGTLGIVAIFLGPVRSGFAVNINVVRGESAGGVGVRDLLEQSLAGVRAQLRISRVSAAMAMRLGGEAAMAVDFDARRGGSTLRLRQLVTIHDGRPYFVTFSAPEADFTEFGRDLSALLSSWRWS